MLITRCGGNPGRYAARFAGRVGIIPFVGGRDPAAEARLRAALARARSDFFRDPLAAARARGAGRDLWVAGEGWWLPTAPLAETANP